MLGLEWATQAESWEARQAGARANAKVVRPERDQRNGKGVRVAAEGWVGACGRSQGGGEKAGHARARKPRSKFAFLKGFGFLFKPRTTKVWLHFLKITGCCMEIRIGREQDWKQEYLFENRTNEGSIYQSVRKQSQECTPVPVPKRTPIKDGPFVFQTNNTFLFYFLKIFWYRWTTSIFFYIVYFINLDIHFISQFGFNLKFYFSLLSNFMKQLFINSSSGSHVYMWLLLLIAKLVSTLYSISINSLIISAQAQNVDILFSPISADLVGSLKFWYAWELEEVFLSPLPEKKLSHRRGVVALHVRSCQIFHLAEYFLGVSPHNC